MNTFSSENPRYRVHMINQIFCRLPWNTVTTGSWLKYPSPITPHVTHVDYLSRHVDPVTGHLHTVRLLTCRQNAPEFIVRLIGGQNVSMVLERSVVDRDNRTLTLQSRNLTYAHMMTVDELCIYEAHPTLIEDNGNGGGNGEGEGNGEWTRFTQEARIRSWSSWSYLRESLEEFGVSRFQANAHKGRMALEQVLHNLRHDAHSLLTQRFGRESFEQHVLNARRVAEIAETAAVMASEALLEQE